MKFTNLGGILMKHLTDAANAARSFSSDDSFWCLQIFNRFKNFGCSFYLEENGEEFSSTDNK